MKFYFHWAAWRLLLAIAWLSLAVSAQTLTITNTLQLAWPADRLGWMLQVQTNDLSTGLGINWISLPGSTTSTQFSAPIVPSNPTVFYRLVYQ
jgi:hypothetical protein